MRLSPHPVASFPCYTVISDLKPMYLVFDGTVNHAFEVEFEFREGEVISLFQYDEKTYTLFVNDYAVAGVVNLHLILSYLNDLALTVPILSYHTGNLAERPLPTLKTPFVWTGQDRRLVYGRATPHEIVQLREDGFPVESSPLLIDNHLVRVVTGFGKNTLHVSLSPHNYSGGWILDHIDVAGFFNRVFSSE